MTHLTEFFGPSGEERFAGRCGASAKKRNDVRAFRKTRPSVDHIGPPDVVASLARPDGRAARCASPANRIWSIR
ncbi:hypothetical protein QW131_02330 [Roseibium salinum]|nr:hypothetical protein [Roseibium salinum]